jgi:hypothetical protein
MGDPWVSGVPTMGGTATGSHSVVEVLASVEAREKAGYITAFECERIRTRIERASYSTQSHVNLNPSRREP